MRAHRTRRAGWAAALAAAGLTVAGLGPAAFAAAAPSSAAAEAMELGTADRGVGAGSALTAVAAP